MSLPAWECGLKYTMNYQKFYPTTVTPCVGVWIEMIQVLKTDAPFIVTPCVGVWIEIFWVKTLLPQASVTPCVGVWIEIN